MEGTYVDGQWASLLHKVKVTRVCGRDCFGFSQFGRRAVRKHENIAIIVLLEKVKICRDPGSNRGPLDLQSNALPTELSRLLL